MSFVAVYLGLNKQHFSSSTAHYAGLLQSLKILESPGIRKRKFQALESPWNLAVVLENPGMGKIFHL